MLQHLSDSTQEDPNDHSLLSLRDSHESTSDWRQGQLELSVRSQFGRAISSELKLLVDCVDSSRTHWQLHRDASTRLTMT